MELSVQSTVQSSV